MSVCTKTWTNFVQCLFVVHIIGRRVSGNQDKNLVRQDRSLRLGTIAEHSHKLAWRTLIDSPARIEVRNRQGPYAEARKPHGRTVEIGPESLRGLMCSKPTDERWSRCWLTIMLFMGDYALRTCLGEVTTE
jgi:hypothetical protein